MFLNNWFILSLFASFFIIGSELIYKFTDCSKIEPELYVSIMWIIGGLISLIYFIYNENYKKKISYSLLNKISIIALLIFSGNILYWKSSNKIYNPGLSRSIFSVNSASLLYDSDLVSFLFAIYLAIDSNVVGVIMSIAEAMYIIFISLISKLAGVVVD